MEKLLYRILLGYTQYNPGVSLKIKNPNMEVRYSSCLIYDRLLNRSKENNLLSEKEIHQIMEHFNIWTQGDGDNFFHLPKQIEEFKLQMFRNIHSTANQSRLRSFLRTAKETYSKLLIKRHMYDYMSAEGVANFGKWQYIISKSTFRGKKLWNWSKGNTYDALNTYYKNIISEDEIRDIARSSAWESIFNTEHEIFGKPMVELTTDQQRLLSWSHLYKAAYEQSDYPPSLLVNDNDIFDGWLINNSRERNKLNPDKIITNKKIANSDEIFLPANNKTDIALIQSMNSDRSNAIIRERIERVKKEGEVLHKNFKDVQMRRFEK